MALISDLRTLLKAATGKEVFLSRLTASKSNLDPYVTLQKIGNAGSYGLGQSNAVYDIPLLSVSTWSRSAKTQDELAAQVRAALEDDWWELTNETMTSELSGSDEWFVTHLTFRSVR